MADLTLTDATHDLHARAVAFADRDDVAPVLRVQAHALAAQLEATISGTKSDGPYCPECGGRWKHWDECPEVKP